MYSDWQNLKKKSFNAVYAKSTKKKLEVNCHYTFICMYVMEIICLYI